MMKGWIVYFLCIITLKFQTVAAGVSGHKPPDWFGRGKDNFDRVTTIIGVIIGSIFFLIIVGCLCCCLCPFCFLHKSRRGRIIRRRGQGNQPQQQNLVPQQTQQIQGGAYPQQQTAGYLPPQAQAAGYPPSQPQATGYPPPQQPQAASYPPPQPQAAGYPPPQPQAAGYPPQQPQAAGYPPQYPQTGPQSGYPPPSGFPQYPPPYPGPAMENAPPLATKSSDYGQQPAFNPNA